MTPVSNLPQEINNGMGFFHACLEEKVIIVPGIYFDLNPSHRRDLFDSPAHHFVRLSYGPSMETLERALDGMERIIQRAKKHQLEKKEEAKRDDEISTEAYIQKDTHSLSTLGQSRQL